MIVRCLFIHRSQLVLSYAVHTLKHKLTQAYDTNIWKAYNPQCFDAIYVHCWIMVLYCNCTITYMSFYLYSRPLCECMLSLLCLKALKHLTIMIIILEGSTEWSTFFIDSGSIQDYSTFTSSLPFFAFVCHFKSSKQTQLWSRHNAFQRILSGDFKYFFCGSSLQLFLQVMIPGVGLSEVFAQGLLWGR